MNALTDSALSQQAQRITHAINNTVEWLAEARQCSTRLEREAERLHRELQRCKITAHRLTHAASEPFSIGLYGHALAVKTQLVTLFGHQPLTVDNAILAIRYRPAAAATAPCITLLTESDLIRLLFNTAGKPPIDDTRLNAQRVTLMRQRQTEIIAGMCAEQVMALWDTLARYQPHTDDAAAFWFTAAELAPYLNIDQRAQLFSPLWNEQAEFTALYRQLAHALRHFGDTPQCYLPADELCHLNGLIDGSLALHLNLPTDTDVQLQLLNERHHQQCDFSGAELALLATEVCLTQCPHASPFNEPIELLDIPADVSGNDHDNLIMRVLQAKRACLLDEYSARRQPQRLLVNAAVKQQQDIVRVGKALTYWLQCQRGAQLPRSDADKPDLIWLLTADRHASVNQSWDEAVQRYVGTPGIEWGALLAIDNQDIQRMLAYLTANANGAAQRQRLAGQWQALQRHLSDTLMIGWYQPNPVDEPALKQQTAQRLLKALQARTGVHGELLERLLPSRDALRRVHQRTVPPPQPDADTFSIGIELDLLSENTPVSRTTTGESHFAHAVFQFWIAHLRTLANHSALLQLIDVDQSTLNLLVEELITAAFRLELPQQLQQAVCAAKEVEERQISQALSVLGDFVAWLGFQQRPLAQRPASRIHHGQAIFVIPAMTDVANTARLTHLAATPVNGAAFYIYDWLVGLNALIEQNSGYSAATTLDARQRARLASILSA
ncbi:virulence factor SrfC family protein [Serratia sp. NPDC078593]|uniref:virulence factor SrfC family protein n=1 Tax=unclassified Serratia (in: enterobacteria) TaxID=2647522 RepID=UPI0037CCCF1A